MTAHSTAIAQRGAFGIRGPLGTVPAWLGLIGFLHCVGMAGVVWYDAATILDLTVFNLLFSTAVVLGFGHSDDAWRWVLTAYITYAVEVIGVHTGFPFGDYVYGTRLGPSLYEVPPMIGVLWLLTLSGTMYWSQQWVPQQGRQFDMRRAAITATLMVAMDLIIEPVAIRTGYWQWSGDTIPVQNYIAWWFIAFALAWGWRHTMTFRTNRAAGWLLVVQTLFFIGILLLPWKS